MSTILTLVRHGVILLALGTVSSFTVHSSSRLPVLRPFSSALHMGVTIYGHAGSRSPLVNWACLELGVTFEMGDLSRNPHPFGQLPCLTDDDDVLVFESGAILQYLHQKHAANKMSPKGAAAVTAWITWANASLDPICFLETPEGKVYDTGLRKPNRRMDRFEELLKERKRDGAALCLVPEVGFTSADVAVASYLLYTLQFFPNVLDGMGQWPTVVEYMKECAQRQSYGKAFGGQVQSSLVEKLQEPTSGAKKKFFGAF
jgi:glutathione S-transferase